MPSAVRGAAQHQSAVNALIASYHRIPDGRSVRLAKKTSNLFRPRAATDAPGLDVTGLDGVISIDPDNATADVQGMCTYEDLVEVTLAYGLMPTVVPQLRTITLGGAVSGLGVAATSFRNGLPHEAVLEMDVFTGAGEVVTCSRAGEHSDLFWTFPNSYGSLGYATRLRIRLEKVPPFVSLRHVRFDDPDVLASAIAQICAEGQWDGIRVDGLDGVAFEPGEYYLTLAEFTDAPGPTSDYTGQNIYYRSLQQRSTDRLTILDYLWRWDTDWFWCSGAFGVQNPTIRRLWPKRWKRSDVYHKLVGLDLRFGIADRIDTRKGNPLGERVVQDIEVPVQRLPEFLTWFDAEVGMRPVWLCPLIAREAWSTYPLRVGAPYVNVGFWGMVAVGPDRVNAPVNRAIEAKVSDLDGHKSLYSEAFYSPEEFDSLYNGTNLAQVKKIYDPQGRLTSLYDKAVRRR
ncbi:MAG: FAD-binding oxidoreductase [Marmoricola sp.]